MIPLPTLRKLLRECFSETSLCKNGNIQIPEADHVDWLKQLGERLSAIPDVDCNQSTYRHGDIKVAGLFVKATAGEPHLYDYLILKFYDGDKVDGLWIHHQKRRRSATMPPPTPVSSVEELESLIIKITEQQKRNQLRGQRSQKIASLRQTSLTSQLKELGQEMNFSFAIGQSKRDILLSLRVNGRKSGFHFSFPKGKLEAVIGQVPDLISMLDHLQSLGVSFRAHNKRWSDRQCEWIDPRPKTTNNQ